MAAADCEEVGAADEDDGGGLDADEAGGGREIEREEKTAGVENEIVETCGVDVVGGVTTT